MNPEECIREHMSELRDTYMVDRLGIFGSFARDEATEASDVDILVEFSKTVGLFHFIELQERLSELIGRKVDLGEPEALKLVIKEQVLKEVIWI